MTSFRAERALTEFMAALAPTRYMAVRVMTASTSIATTRSLTVAKALTGFMSYLRMP